MTMKYSVPTMKAVFLFAAAALALPLFAGRQGPWTTERAWEW